jgi:hypothetical protein
MTHDPLCPFAKWDDVDCYQHDAGVRICDLIAKVRDDMLAKAIAAVDGLGTYGIDSSPNLGDALAALRALGDSDE